MSNQGRNRRAGVGHARLSRALGASDPRIGRNPRAATAAELTLGTGLEYDREGKLRLRPGTAVRALPEGASLADIQAWAADLDRALRTAGIIPR